MDVVRCGSCQRIVVPKHDGLCPSCQNRLIAPAVDDPARDGGPTAAEGEAAEPAPMELPPAVASPQLEDPIREMTWLFQKSTARIFWVTLLLVVVIAAVAFLTEDGLSGLPMQIVVLAAAGGLFALLAFVGMTVGWRAFAPRRATDVFYLRSFKNDSKTWPIRVEIQEALGPRWRLSGIRDPLRRTLSLSQRFVPLFTAMKYCTPRFMDLEAGSDWQVRLWNSLNAGRIAMLDLSTETPFVLDEIQIAVEALGSGRIVCLGHAPQTVDEIRAIVAQRLGSDAAAGVHNIVVWPGNDGYEPSSAERKAFRDRIREITLPLLSHAPIRRVCPVRYGPAAVIGRKADEMFWALMTLQGILLGLQFALAAIIGFSVSSEKTQNQLVALISGPLVIVNAWLLLQNWLTYIQEVGVRRERVKASIGLAIVAAAFLLSIGPAVLPLFDRADSRKTVANAALTGAALQQELDLDRDDLKAEDQSRLGKRGQ